ncbi:MAG: glycosyltransferase family 4 protein [Gammaproteobacteria bacterium]|nr:glycosyltransferase family 4 protein [Gammaproteobacteria bacterium]
MHICHINLARGFRGGERQTLLLIKGLSKKNIHQTLICRKHHMLADKAATLENLTIIALDKPFLLNILKTRQFDLVHAHEGRASHFAFYSHLLTKKPYLITRRIPNLPKNFIPTLFVYKYASRIVALSQAIKNNLLDYQPKLNIDIIPSMCSDLDFDAHNVEVLKKKHHDKFIVGHIGALVNHHKGQRNIIEAAKKLEHSHPNMQFLLVGGGKDEEWLKKEAESLSNVEFTGFVDNVGDYLKLFDLFVFPSLEEGFGSILLDAMQYQVPIIASNVDGIPDFVKNENNGLLISPNNTQQLIDAILKLESNRSLAETLAVNATETVNSHSINKIADSYLNIYCQLLPQFKNTILKKNSTV